MDFKFDLINKLISELDIIINRVKRDKMNVENNWIL